MEYVTMMRTGLFAVPASWIQMGFFKDFLSRFAILSVGHYIEGYVSTRNNLYRKHGPV